jgi:hypothetical protein
MALFEQTRRFPCGGVHDAEPKVSAVSYEPRLYGYDCEPKYLHALVLWEKPQGFSLPAAELASSSV